MDGQQLAALAAVVEHGSFDAAADRLHVTPSAISQRIKALEQRVGQVVVVREKPCVATAAGVPLLRLAAQTALLEAEALAEMGGGDGASPRIALAVNADSMATWFTAVFDALDDVLFDIRIEDQDHSARLLREGVVMGAVTTERTPVSGCRVQPLGVMRYVPVASPAYVERHLPDGFTAHAVATAPSLAWNRDDALQDMLVRKAISSRHHAAAALRPDGGRIRWRGAGGAWVGNVPGDAGRTCTGGRLVRSSGRRAPRRTAVLAVLEARQSVGRGHHRGGASGRRRPANLAGTDAWKAGQYLLERAGHRCYRRSMTQFRYDYDLLTWMPSASTVALSCADIASVIAVVRTLPDHSGNRQPVCFRSVRRPSTPSVGVCPGRKQGPEEKSHRNLSSAVFPAGNVV